jgi:sulfur-carrier protein
VVTLLFFAKLREAVGTGEEQIDLPYGLRTVGDLADWLEARHSIFADRDRLRVAVDRAMARFDTDITHATEIAFFPPVTGG